MRIAVIGSGVAGLSAAWLLSSTNEVVLYEQDRRIGGHANTVDVPGQDGPIAVDTGFIVMNRRNYPLLSKTFDHLNVRTTRTGMSFGVSAEGGALEWSGTKRGLFAQPCNILRPEFMGMLADILRFNRVASAFASAPHDDVPLGVFLQRNGFGQALSRWYLLPMVAAIWSAPIEMVLGHSARSVLRFFANHGLLKVVKEKAWCSVEGGSRTYVQRMARPLLANARIGTGVSKVRPGADGVTVVDRHGATDRFDQVILAAHADQTLAMLDPPTEAERRLLGKIPYQPNRVVLHGDGRLMPKRRSVWSCWNHLAERKADGSAAVAVTYWMNRLQNLPGETPLFVSLNPFTEPDPATVHAEFRYDHPVFSTEAVRAQGGIDQIQGVRGLWFCGAWTGNGFHEDGIRSGVAVAQRLGAHVPWQTAQDRPSHNLSTAIGPFRTLLA